jgi:peptidoglycan-associated lipoprotein
VTLAPRPAPLPKQPPPPESPLPVDRENNIYFELGSAEIDPASRETLRKLAARLKADGDAGLALIGHTDDLGSPEFNIALGQKRANAVAQALIALGVAPRRIRMTSLGNELADAAHCVTERCKATTRRVELRVIE